MSGAPDTVVLISSICFTLLGVAHSYWAGGDVVRSLHDIKVQDGATTRTYPGWYAEVAVALVIVLGVLILQALIPGTQIFEHWAFVGIFVISIAAIALIAHRHATHVIETTPDGPQENFRKKLKASYRFYIFHAAMVFAVSFMLCLKLLFHVYVSYDAFQVRFADYLAASLQVQAALAAPLGSDGVLQVAQLAVSYRGIARSILGALEPYLVLTICTIGVNMVLVATPLRRVFRKEALDFTRYLSVGFIFVLGLLAVLAFQIQYQALAQDYRAVLQAALAAEPRSLEDFAFLMAELEQVNANTGLAGFLRLFLAEGGLFVILLALLRFGLPVLLGQRTKLTED